VTYVHVPFVQIEHSNLGAGIEDSEEVTNLGHGELYAEDLPADAEIEVQISHLQWVLSVIYCQLYHHSTLANKLVFECLALLSVPCK